MKQKFLTAIYGFATLTAVLAAPAAFAQSSAITLITSDANGATTQYGYDLYQTGFASKAGGFAVASTSPNFGGSTMATASTTEYLHYASAGLLQSFALPSFITSAEITIDFMGQAFATGNAAAAIAYSIERATSGVPVVVASAVAVSTQYLDLGGTAGSVTLSARETFTLSGGQSITIFTRSLAETGYKEGYGVFNLLAGPGYATAFMDPVVSISAAVPEPATWAMLIAGFGLVGIGARRRRSRPAARASLVLIASERPL